MGFWGFGVLGFWVKYGAKRIEDLELDDETDPTNSTFEKMQNENVTHDLCDIDVSYEQVNWNEFYDGLKTDDGEIVSLLNNAEEGIIDLTNKIRLHKGLPALVINPTLTDDAHKFLKRMKSENRLMRYISPQADYEAQMIRFEGDTSNNKTTYHATFDFFLRLGTMLDRELTDIGCACEKDNDGNYWAVSIYAVKQELI